MFHIVMLILHVLGAGVVFGVVFFSILAVIRPAAAAQQLDRLLFVSRLGMWASGWQLITGIVLYMTEQDELKSNNIFWIKLGLYAIEGTFAALVLNRQMKRMAINGQPPAQPRNLVGILIIHALLIGAIIALGVVIVEQ